MTLLEAFRALGPLIGDPETDRAREEAGRVLLDELTRLSRSLTFRDDIIDDLPGIVLESLMKGAVGGRRWNDPDSEGGVRAWLRRCLSNAAITIVRREKAGRCDGSPDEVPSPTLDPERLVVAADEVAQRQGARRQLLEEIAPAVARSMRRGAAEDFLRAVDDLFALADGRVTIEDLVRDRRGAVDACATNAVYQQHSRARERLSRRIEELASTGALGPDQVRHLRATVRSLHRRA